MTWDDRPEEDVWFSVDPKGRREEEEPRRGRRGPSFLSVLLGLVVVAIAVIAWVNHSSADRATPTPTPTTSSPTTPTPSESTSSSSTSTTPAPTVTTVAGTKPPLGATRPWDLFVASERALVRVEMATGRQTRVDLPLSPDGSPVVVIDLGTSVLVQPVYNGTGTIVRDDGVSTTATGRFPGPGLILRALGTERLWLSRTPEQRNTLDLIGTDGKVVPKGSVALSADLYADSARSDGGLALLVEGVDGSYRVADGRTRRVTTGQLLGRSETGWLVQECDDDHRCRMALVDRATGRRTDVGPPIANPASGSISPDGRRALVVEYRQDGTGAVLVDLGSGARRTVGGVSGASAWGGGGSNTVWSPDSRWAVSTNDTGDVVAVDAATGRVTELPYAGDAQFAAVSARYR